MQNMQKPDERPVGVRLQNLEERLDLLEQVGEGGLPAIRLAGIAFRLDHVEENLRDLKGDMRDFKEEVNRRFGKVETHIDSSINRLTTIIGLCTGVITLAMLLGRILIP